MKWENGRKKRTHVIMAMIKSRGDELITDSSFFPCFSVISQLQKL